MLQQLQQYLRAAASQGRATERLGPFLLTTNAATASPFLNYAIPDDDARPTGQEIAALVAAMEARERIPRLEYLERTAPAVLEALEGAGFAVELRPPVMVASAAARVGLAEGYGFLEPAEDADRRALLAVQNVAYGAAPEVDAEQLARSRAVETAGGVVLAIRAPDGTTAGGGVTTELDGSGFTEIAGIAVAEAHRRRGLAAALTAELTRRALAAGVHTVFLTPGDDGAARVYARAGFEGVGHMLHIRRE